MIDNLLCPERFAPAQLPTTKAQIIHAGFDRKFCTNDNCIKYKDTTTATHL